MPAPPERGCGFNYYYIPVQCLENDVREHFQFETVAQYRLRMAEDKEISENNTKMIKKVLKEMDEERAAGVIL